VYSLAPLRWEALPMQIPSSVILSLAGTTDPAIVAAVAEARAAYNLPVVVVGYRAVRWQGRLYWFTAGERPAVARLFGAWASGAPFVPVGEVRPALADSDAWGSLVVPGPDRGGPADTVCLAAVTSPGSSS
jgi:hypothetical protein